MPFCRPRSQVGLWGTRATKAGTEESPLWERGMRSLRMPFSLPRASSQHHDALRLEHWLQSVDKHRLRKKKKITKLVRRSSLGLVDMKPIRPINIPLTAWGTKGLMLLGSNWAGV